MPSRNEVRFPPTPSTQRIEGDDRKIKIIKSIIADKLRHRMQSSLYSLRSELLEDIQKMRQEKMSHSATAEVMDFLDEEVRKLKNCL